ncbi:ParB/RepB/Spo0J family partition protein [Pelagibius sp. Alg239-R121]|uniref:ParB/RepB/Spo0J family partition protein n=1 Tax=Pelagibius sp. Alg239-R121 TaxID=2993448 RepID=UPI0024A704D2|nr:ParB/RepB/Spo0J family partition protein [Pelagibius sp. Alg239-R121]
MSNQDPSEMETPEENQEESEKRTNLGRGLAALFGDENEDYASLDKVRSNKEVPIEHLHPNRFQPRQYFDDEALASLADSIRENGVLQPIVVRRHPERSSEYEIIAGERRWRASQKALLHEVPVVIREFTDSQALEVAIVENVQRQDLSPLEEAEGYRRLMDEFSHTQEDLGRVVGKSRSHIANTLRLLTLPDAVKSYLEQGDLSAGHARALIGADNPESLAKRIVADGLSVRETERVAKRAKTGEQEEPARVASKAPGQASGMGSGEARPVPFEKDADTIALERDLSNMLGLEVAIEFYGKGGSLMIRYETLEQLDDVLHRLNQVPPN